MWIPLLLTLSACDGIMGGDEPPTVDDVEPNPVTAPPEPLDLRVQGGEIGVVAIKDGDQDLPSKLTLLAGTVHLTDADKLGTVSGHLIIDLSSWDSSEQARDEQIRDLFFETSTFPTATFDLTGIDGLPEDGIAVGRSAEGDASGKLRVHGGAVDVAAKVRLTRSAETEYHIDTIEPFLVSVESLGLTSNLQAFIKVAGYESIDDNMRVSVRLDLAKEAAAPPPEKVKPASVRHPPVVKGMKARNSKPRSREKRTGTEQSRPKQGSR